MEILSYRFRGNGTTYETIEEAQTTKATLVAKWAPRFYDDCIFCGDSMIGLDANGNEICELLFLSNGRFCNAREFNQTCGSV